MLTGARCPARRLAAALTLARYVRHAVLMNADQPEVRIAEVTGHADRAAAAALLAEIWGVPVAETPVPIDLMVAFTHAGGSRCGYSSALPGPPHDESSVPSVSNSRTGGAAFQMERVSLDCSVDGRCVIQTWSWASTVTPATAPRIQWLGSGFGQKGSTLNVGTADGDAGDCAVR